MAWFKTKFNDTYHYSIRSCDWKTIYHRCSDLDVAALNDKDRKFDLYHHSFFIQETIKTTNKKDVVELPSGIYTGRRVDNAIDCSLAPLELNTELQLLNLETNNILSKDFNTFIKSKKIYSTFSNKAYKKGVLLYGPPGTGKSISIQKLLLESMPKNAIALFIKQVPCLELLSNLAQDSRLKILIFEEICGVLEENELADLLTFLDGEDSLENCYIIASTNYPDKLPENLTNRPGRFDVLFEVGHLSENDRRLFLNSYYKEPTNEEIQITQNMTTVQLTEILLLIKRDKISFTQAVKQLRNHEELAKTRFAKKKDDKDLNQDIL